MGRPPREESRDTRQAFLDAGLELFSEKGYFGTTLREIARAVGVRESALYYYFPSKEALFEAILVQQTTGWQQLAELNERQLGDGPRAFFERMALLLLDHFSTPRERKFFRILQSDGLRLALEGHAGFRERMTEGHLRLVRLMESLIGRGWLRDVQAEVLAMEFVSPLNRWQQFALVEPAHPLVKDRKAFVRSHVEHFLRGAQASQNP